MQTSLHIHLSLSCSFGTDSASFCWSSLPLTPSLITFLFLSPSPSRLIFLIVLYFPLCWLHIGFRHCDIGLSESFCLWAARAAYFRQQHWDYFETGVGIVYQRRNWNLHLPWFEACLALFLPLLSERGDMGLCYVTKDSPDKKTASEPDLWWQAFELWESAWAYRGNTMHT